MYPNSELRHLALRKQLVRLRITLHRAQCEEAGRHVAAVATQGEYWFRTAKAWGGVATLVTTFFGAGVLGKLFHRHKPKEPPKKTRGKLGLAIDLGLLGWKVFRQFRARPATYAGHGE